MASPVCGYDAEPCYAIPGVVGAGYRSAVADLLLGVVLAVDGPAAVDWDVVITEICDALSVGGLAAKPIDMRTSFAPWPEILRRIASAELADDPDFAELSCTSLAEFFDTIADVSAAPDAVTVVFGPGAALVAHDRLWYVDLPKRYAEAGINSGSVRTLGQPAGTGPGTTRRLFYIDWPVLDQHRDSLIADIDLWLDTQEPDSPGWLDGPALRAAFAHLASRPFRTRPTLNTTSWGGHWAQQRLGFNPEAANTALGYELIAPESGILVGDPDGARVELPLQALVALHPVDVLGADVHTTFGTSFPLRFDHLDTVGGGNLSVHCHPQPDYMRRVFGWPYTQHEAYYMMVGGPDRKVFLSPRQDIDIEAFRREADTEGQGWHEDIIGQLPEMFFEIRRLHLAPNTAVDDNTNDRFHILNVVEGAGILLETATGVTHPLAHAETLTVPAAVGTYRVHALGTAPASYVKALVP